MRNKIKQLMNKEEGFTLVELLAVIVILGIIVMIAVPQIGNVISRARSGATTAEQELVIDAARLYMVENEMPADDTLSVQELVDAGYLEETDSSNIESSDTVTIEEEDTTSGGKNYTYTFNE